MPDHWGNETVNFWDNDQKYQAWRAAGQAAARVIGGSTFWHYQNTPEARLKHHQTTAETLSKHPQDTPEGIPAQTA